MPTDNEIQLRAEWGRRVRSRRELLRMAQTDLAEKCGTSRQRIYQVETGECGTGDALKLRLAAALGVPAGDLFPYPDTAAAS